MVEISELYKSVGNRIKASDLKTIKQPLTISSMEIVGKTRKGLLLHFTETELAHRCNRVDVNVMSKKFSASNTDKFKGQKITLVAENQENGKTYIRIKV
jgi:hypothetical protein